MGLGDSLNKQAVVWFTGDECRPGVAPFEGGLATIESQTIGLFLLAVAFEALVGQDRPDAQLEELERFGRKLLCWGLRTCIVAGLRGRCDKKNQQRGGSRQLDWRVPGAAAVASDSGRLLENGIAHGFPENTGLQFVEGGSIAEWTVIGRGVRVTKRPEGRSSRHEETGSSLGQHPVSNYRLSGA